MVLGKESCITWTVSNSSDKLRQYLTVDGSEGEKKKSEIWLWHRLLGHASFGYLKKLFPSLFVKFDVSSFHCDVCELTKIHRASFPLSLNKSPVPFMVIHSDVWGPSKVCLMKSKSEVNLLFQNFYKMVRTQYNA